MPPRKKRQKVNQNAQPGVARGHLEQNFSTIPETCTNLKNGHVLYLFTSCGKSRIQTERDLRSHYTLLDGEGYSIAAVDSRIKSLVAQTLNKFKKLSNPTEFRSFANICDESFQLMVGDSRQNDSSDTGNIDSDSLPTSESQDLGVECMEVDIDPPPPPNIVETPSDDAPKPMPSTRSSTEKVTPRKQKLKKRLFNVSSSKAAEGVKFRKRITELKSKLKVPKRVVNQEIKRKQNTIAIKNRTIKDLRAKLNGNALAKELAQTRAELIQLKRTHNQLINSRKSKKKNKKKSTVSSQQYNKLLLKYRASQEDVKRLEFENMVLQEQVEEFESTTNNVESKIDKKTYSPAMRMKVFDCVVNKTPTGNIPTLISQLSKRSSIELDHVPQRSAVEMMARELGAISELQTAEVILASDNVTLGFDATTQEEMHVNSIHFTTRDTCVAAAVDDLPGGTAEDYAQHICQTIDSLSETYCFFNEQSDYQETRKNIINKISNTLTDRCAANHASIRIVNSEWGKSLNELYCHLHPLDSIATQVRSTLKGLEETRGKVFGKDCLAGNIVLQMNKLRYKNGKGDPRGFVAFLDDRNIARGILPRYRGNRLHILFHISGKLIEYYDDFIDLLATGTSCGGLRNAILQDFQQPAAKTQLQILGLLGKYLTGPWMKKFYTSSENQINHVEGIQVVKQVIIALKDAAKSPETVPMATENFFGDKVEDDATLAKLCALPLDPQFGILMKGCLEAIVTVLERQYAKYFELDITDKLREETESARSHNIDAEEIMGMFSSSKQKSPNASMCYLSCRMRACKNKTVNYLDNLEESRREEVLRKAVKLGRRQRFTRKKKQKDLRSEIIRRQKEKEHARDTRERKKLEKRLRETDIETVRAEYPNLDYSNITDMHDLLNGKVVGRKACHVWFDDNKLEVYNAKFEKYKKAKNQVYKVAYWLQSEDYDNAEEYDMPVYQLIADILHGDLVFC